MKLLLPLLLASSLAVASVEEPKGLGGDEDENAFVASTSCSTILLGAVMGPGTTEDDENLVKSAQFHYFMVSQAIYKKLSFTDKWGGETYDSMYNAVADAIEKLPQENIQLFGEACIKQYNRFVTEMDEGIERKESNSPRAEDLI